MAMNQNTLKIASSNRPDTPGSSTGSGGMDRKIQRSSHTKWLKLLALFLLVCGIAYLLVYASSQGRALAVQGERQRIATVNSGLFEDYIPLRASVVPLTTVYLDVVQGGRVEQVLVDDGALLMAGAPLVRLSNSDLQLSVMDTESRVMEQLNAMRDQELRLEQNRLGHKRALVEIHYNIVRLKRDIRQQRELLESKHISQSQFDALQDELSYYQQKKAVTEESQASDAKLMRSQLAFIADKNKAMESNLAFARDSLDSLNVAAPVAGRLSGFNLQVGQSISRGERVGQIDSPELFKLKAEIDEYYLGRVSIGQHVELVHEGSDFELSISKIYPDVKNGRFEVDLLFKGEPPEGIRRGQSLQAKLTLGDAQQTLMIPAGNFFQDTGGRWVFVIDADGAQARKREVSLGRRNKQFIEVVSGLQAGERVIISSYSAFGDVERLKLDDAK